MNNKRIIACIILSLNLLLINTSVLSAYANSTKYGEEIQLELERLENRLSKQIGENKNNLAHQYKLLDGFKNRLDDHKWFFLTLLTLLTGGAFLYIKNTIDSKIEKELKKSSLEERIQDKLDKIETDIKSVTKQIEEIAKLKDKAIKDAEDIEYLKDETPVQQ